MKINEKAETASDMYKPGNVIVSHGNYYLVTSEYSLVDLVSGTVCVTSDGKESLISSSYDKNNDRLLKGTHLVTF